MKMPKIKPEWKTAFLAAVILGLLIHMPILTSDIPNHDGLESMYFDQNMITSGRWFLTIACGFSSYYTLPWLIGVLGIFFLGLTAAALTEILEIHNRGVIIIISGLLVAFPALASTFSYVYTLDGYMLALLLAVSAVLLTGKYRFGFIGGGICLAFSLGIYQSYLPFAILLSIYGILMIAMKENKEGGGKGKIRSALNYLWMGITGIVLYFLILQVLLKIQGKELASYQGINEMGAAKSNGLMGMAVEMYRDFFAFTVKGNVLVNNVFAAAAFLVLVLLAGWVLLRLTVKQKWWKSPWFYLLIIVTPALVPLSANVILVISPEVTYHILMRYQWVLLPILLLAFTARFRPEAFGRKAAGRIPITASVLALLAGGVLVFNYCVMDNIAYSNLQKKYEKTYAYCIRLLDRMEQTDGYYQGIPVAMVGVVGDESYPLTDITGKVTSGMIGMTGDSLLYTGANYQDFMKHYLGATLNFLPAEEMGKIYYTEAYREMGSFPAVDSIRIVDGIMYVKTENVDRSEE